MITGGSGGSALGFSNGTELSSGLKALAVLTTAVVLALALALLLANSANRANT